MKVIITGTTGMVGEGVLLECLANPRITEVLSVSRKSTNRIHPKLKEYIVPDFLWLNENDYNLAGYDACFFCAGVSSLGMKELEYTRITYDTTLNFAKALNPKSEMSFIYVSGMGTKGCENSGSMWSRVKSKTENDLMKMPFKQVIALRLGFLKAVKGQKNLPTWYKFGSWLYPILRFFGVANSLQEVAGIMICIADYGGYKKNVMEVKDIFYLIDLK